MRLPRNTPSGHPGIPGSPISATGTVTGPRSSRSSSSDPLQGAREGALVRMRARVEYDGTDFAGFQLQLRARTVQGELEAALATISGGNRVRVDAAGRTDAGVHATGQVIAFTDLNGRPGTELVRALDALLPEDVAIREVRPVPDGVA